MYKKLIFLNIFPIIEFKLQLEVLDCTYGNESDEGALEQLVKNCYTTK